MRLIWIEEIKVATINIANIFIAIIVPLIDAKLSKFKLKCQLCVEKKILKNYNLKYLLGRTQGVEYFTNFKLYITRNNF